MRRAMLIDEVLRMQAESREDVESFPKRNVLRKQTSRDKSAKKKEGRVARVIGPKLNEKIDKIGSIAVEDDKDAIAP
jgi:hypothetical protein